MRPHVGMLINDRKGSAKEPYVNHLLEWRAWDVTTMWGCLRGRPSNGPRRLSQRRFVAADGCRPRIFELKSSDYDLESR